jgi:hypothetical protein
MPQTILLIRHAEKPAPPDVGGVTEDGRSSSDDLSVTGWQRAGAYVSFFGDGHRHPGIARPDRLYAARPTSASSSRRCVSTLEPLARMLGIDINTAYAKGDEAALAKHLSALDGVALVAWDHRHLPMLAGLIATSDGGQPPAFWPQDRYDVVWLFVAADSRTRRFVQVAQLLLAGDRDSTF